MNASRKSSRALSVANIFGTLGYISLIIQWVWTGIILVYPLILSGTAESWWNCLQPKATKPPTTVAPTDFGSATSFINVFAIILTAVILAISIILIFRLPKKIGETGAHLTQSAANAVIPIIYRAEEMPKAKRKRLSFKIIVTTKCLLTLLALALLLFAQPISQLSFSVIWALGSFCFVCTMIYWLIQYLIARFYRVNQSKIW